MNDDLTLRSARALRFGALLLLFFGVVEALVVGQPVWESIAARLVWGAGALGAATALTRGGPRLRAVAMGAVGASAPFFYGVIVSSRGGTSGVPFTFFPALPLAIAVLLHGEFVAATSCALTTPAVALAIAAREDSDVRQLAEWALVMSGASAVAIYGAVLTRRMRRSERESENARHQVQVQLARSELALAEADRLALIGQLSAGLSHEVNNPLAIVVANTHELKLELAGVEAKNPDVAELLEGLEVGARRITRLMQELAAITPGAEATLESCSLEELVDEALALPVGSLGVAVDNRVSPALPPVQAARSQLRRALGHLASFLVESAQHGLGGRVVRLLVLGREEGERVVLEVRAEVGGVGSEAAPGPVRAGLGLALIRESMRRWGGELETESDRGRNTSVRLFFRRSNTSAAEAGQ